MVPKQPGIQDYSLESVLASPPRAVMRFGDARLIVYDVQPDFAGVGMRVLEYADWMEKFASSLDPLRMHLRIALMGPKLPAVSTADSVMRGQFSLTSSITSPVNPAAPFSASTTSLLSLRKLMTTISIATLSDQYVCPKWTLMDFLNAIGPEVEHDDSVCRTILALAIDHPDVRAMLSPGDPGAEALNAAWTGSIWAIGGAGQGGIGTLTLNSELLFAPRTTRVASPWVETSQCSWQVVHQTGIRYGLLPKHLPFGYASLPPISHALNPLALCVATAVLAAFHKFSVDTLRGGPSRGNDHQPDTDWVVPEFNSARREFAYGVDRPLFLPQNSPTRGYGSLRESLAWISRCLWRVASTDGRCTRY
eukprot:6444743-Prymnesium_polylepis.1